MFRISFRVGPNSVYVFPYSVPEEGDRLYSRNTVLAFILNVRRCTKSKNVKELNKIITLFYPTKLYLYRHSANFRIPLCRHDVVSLMTRLQGERSGFRLPAGARALFLIQNSRPILEPTQPPTIG